jgi:hypothetical protein
MKVQRSQGLYSELGPACPHCGYEVDPGDAYRYDKDDEFNCPRCEKVSDLEVDRKVTYTTIARTEEGVDSGEG